MTFEKKAVCWLQAHPKLLQKWQGWRLPSHLCEVGQCVWAVRWGSGWMGHMLATIMYLFPKWAKINYKPKALAC